MYLFSKHKILFIFIYLFFAASTICSAKDFTVVIDPGHGGKDFGAIGKKGYEKNINLGVALKLGKLIDKYCKDVKIIYTRDTDRFLTLQQRANVANKADGDLFISIHTNSISKKSKNYKTIKGSATYTLGLHKTEENLEVAKRENAVIELESDYTEAYRGFDPNSSESYIIFEISQSQHLDQSISFASLVQDELTKTAKRKNNGVRQAGFWVLAATSMPAVLIELDFICNPDQEKYLLSKSGQEQLAKAIFNAFKNYKEISDNKKAIVNRSQLYEESGPDDAEYNGYPSKNTPGQITMAENKQVRTADNKQEIDSERSLRSDKKDQSSISANNNKTGLISQRENPSNSINENQDSSDHEAIIYKIQIMTSGKKLRPRHPEFRKLSPVDYYYDNGLYKYTYGETSELSEANKLLKTVQTKFKDAFIVKFKNGKRIK